MAQRKEIAVGQHRCHGWTHMNHPATDCVSRLSFASLIQGTVVREVSERVLGCLWGSQLLMGEKKIRMSNVAVHITNAS